MINSFEKLVMILTYSFNTKDFGSEHCTNFWVSNTQVVISGSISVLFGSKQLSEVHIRLKPLETECILSRQSVTPYVSLLQAKYEYFTTIGQTMFVQSKTADLKS